MTIRRLSARVVEKVWGRTNLPPTFVNLGSHVEPVGEIIFDLPAGTDPELLVKYLFTSERLSIQVHPDDAAAIRRGQKRGKDEAWVVIDADESATIAIGTHEPLTKDRLRQAAVDGSIEQLVEWHEVKAGDSFYSAAGTIHAIGAGVALVEVQQNSDVTYRLYDYGRPRELHLDEAVEAADPRPYAPEAPPVADDPGTQIIAHGPAFSLERWSGSRTVRIEARPERPLWLIPLGGVCTMGGERLQAGTVWFADEAATLSLDDAGDILLAAPGPGGIA